MFSLICAWINSWVSTREACDLRRHLAQYDVTVMKLMFGSEGWHFRSFHCALFPTTKRYSDIFSPRLVDLQAITLHRIDALRSAAVFQTFSDEFYGIKCLFSFIFHCNSNTENYRLRVSIALCNSLIPHMLLTQFNDECSFWFSNDVTWSTNGASKSPKAKATNALANMYNFLVSTVAVDGLAP